MITKEDDKQAVPKGAASHKTLRNKLAQAGLTYTPDAEDNAVVSYDGKLWTVRATESGFSVSMPGRTTLNEGCHRCDGRGERHQGRAPPSPVDPSPGQWLTSAARAARGAEDGVDVQSLDGSDGAVTWLDTITKEMLANLPQRAFAPSLIFDFDHVREAVAMAEAAIIRKQDATQTERREIATKAAQNPFHSYVKDLVFTPMGEALYHSALTFPLILRRALLIAICSHIEHALKQWCAMLHATWQLPMKTRTKPGKASADEFPKRQHESDLHYCMRYLHDVAGLALGDFDQWAEWAAIDAYRLARNCLAHSGGIVEDENDDRRKETIDALRALPKVGVEVDGLLAAEPTIVLDAGACEAAADTAKTFFERLTLLAKQDPRSQAP
jgi:hypothetical protein